MTTDSSGSRRLLPGRQNSHKMDMINGRNQKSTNQAPPSSDGADEFEDETLVTPESLSHRIGGFQRNSGSVNWGIFGSVKIVLFKSKLNVLIPCGFLAILVNYVTRKHGWVFPLSLLGIIPLAERLGFATEQLALFTGPTVGGLLNATFGNATELIISIHALRSGKLRVVQQSLLGSILSNLLLVLGCAFFSGGLTCGKTEQTFSKADAVVNSGLLLMAVMGLLSPAVLHYTHSEVHFGKSELALSRFSSCIMLVAYASYIYFELSNGSRHEESNEGRGENEGGDDDVEVPEISKWESIAWLAILTVWISVLSDYLVDAIDGASKAWNIPIAFISVVLLPIVGNAAEHASAVMFAQQISMFGIPFCVVIGWMMGQPMDLNFHLFETASLLITVLVVAFLLQDGTSNCLKGLMLFLCYLIVAASFYVHADPNTDGSYCWQITVVCISKGERNHQPSSREQAMADYVFYRFFDVGNCTLSDQLPEKIAGQEVNVLLNPKDEQVTSCSDQGVRGMNQKVDEGPIATVPLPQSAVKEDESPVAGLLQFPSPVSGKGGG